MKYSTYESIEMNPDLPVRILNIDTESDEAKAMGFDINKVSYIPRHWHPSIEFTYVLRGSINLNTIDDKRIVHTDEMLLVNSGVIHEVSSVIGQRSEVICLIISDDFLKANIPNFESIKFVLDFDNLDTTFFKQIFTEIMELSLDNNIVNNLKIQSKLLLILSELYNKHTVEESISFTKDNEFIIEVIEWMHKHYNEPLSLVDVADNFNMSREHFSRVFKQSIGESFLQYLYHYRLYRAQKDIFMSDRLLEDIAYDHGFPNVKSLITRFKDYYGDTPGNYRKSEVISIIDHKADIKHPQ